MHSMGDLQVEEKCRIAHEIEGELKFLDDDSESAKMEYDMGDESDRDLGGSGDSNGTLGCRLGIESLSSKSNENNGSPKVPQVQRLRWRPVALAMQVWHGQLGSGWAMEAFQCTHLASLIQNNADMYGTRVDTMGNDIGVVVNSQCTRRHYVLPKNFGTINSDHP